MKEPNAQCDATKAGVKETRPHTELKIKPELLIVAAMDDMKGTGKEANLERDPGEQFDAAVTNDMKGTGHETDLGPDPEEQFDAARKALGTRLRP